MQFHKTNRNKNGFSVALFDCSISEANRGITKALLLSRPPRWVLPDLDMPYHAVTCRTMPYYVSCVVVHRAMSLNRKMNSAPKVWANIRTFVLPCRAVPSRVSCQPLKRRAALHRPLKWQARALRPFPSLSCYVMFRGSEKWLQLVHESHLSCPAFVIRRLRVLNHPWRAVIASMPSRNLVQTSTAAKKDNWINRKSNKRRSHNK